MVERAEKVSSRVEARLHTGSTAVQPDDEAAAASTAHKEAVRRARREQRKAAVSFLGDAKRRLYLAGWRYELPG